jgi:hypothetical protein
MTQMDRVVQQNAALVEEGAAATESLKHRAAALLQVVARFRLAGATDQRHEPAPAPVATPIAPIRVRAEPIRIAKMPELAPASLSARSADGTWQEF